MENFFNLFPESAGQALGVFIFGMILIGSIAVVVTDWLVSLVSNHRLAGVDEFQDRDDVYSIAVKPTYKSDDEFRRIDLKSFTCINCSEQERCPMAFDFYCTDGDCGMK